MTSAKAALGDSHNFGRRVTLRGQRVIKPRSVLWEWLLLARESPLRRRLDEAARSLSGAPPEPFAFLPSLKFFDRSQAGGEVEKLRLAPLPRLSTARRGELAGIVGRALALFSWLGVADLHWENLVLGCDARGRIVFGPVDIEMILADLALPTETKLLPDADPEYGDVCRHACGVRRVLPYLGKPLAGVDLLTMAGAYRWTLDFLDQQARAIAQTLAQLPGLREAPIRVCLRGTGEYVRARSEPLWPPLLDAELEQLARGDIPYFFRLYGRPGIQYFANRALTRRASLPLRGDVPKLDPVLQLSRNLRSPSRQRLRDQGVLALLAAFDHPSLTGRHQSGELELTLSSRRIGLTLPGGEQLSSPRDLSAFVGSVYLPCRCGEVRSVFVPATTRCRASSGN
ncbi:MAG TPA: hypothetical protein VIW29_23120 [Polyangiaceae bacterium]